MLVRSLVFTQVWASQAEFMLHNYLFNNSRYNPRVIPDMWSRKTSSDYENLGSFAAEKCAAYNQEAVDKSSPGGLEVVSLVEYASGTVTKFDQEIRCEDNENIYIKLDKKVAFTIAEGDVLHLINRDFYGKYSTNDIDIDSDWQNTQSNYVRFIVQSQAAAGTQFKFLTKCQSPNFEKKYVLLKEENKPWHREVKCLNQYENLRYRKGKRTKISSGGLPRGKPRFLAQDSCCRLIDYNCISYN